MNRNFLSWLLYDAGNSFTEAALGSLFFAQWIVVDNKLGDFWYSAVFVLATIAILVTSPFWGAWSDRMNQRMPFVKITTLLMLFFAFLLALFSNLSISINQKIGLSLIAALCLQYFYQVSLVFYNSLMEKLSTKTNLGKISGIGQAANNIGWVVAMGFLLLFTNGTINIVPGAGRAQAFLPAFVLTSVFCLPLVIFFKETKNAAKAKANSFKEVYSQTLRGLRELLHKDKNTALYLVAFCLISDAILTVGLYFAIVMNEVYGISDNEKFLIMLVMTLSIVVGGYIFGLIGDRLGLKKVLIIGNIIIMVMYGVAASSSWAPSLYFVALFGGVGWGTFYVVTRSLLIKISPAARLGEYFGFFSTFQRFASIIGPITWSITTLAFRDFGSFKYRAAVFMLTAVMALGTLLLIPVKEERTIL